MKNVERRKELLLSFSALWADQPEPELGILLAAVPLTPAIEQIAYLLQRMVTRTKDQVQFHQQELGMWATQLEGDAQELVTLFMQVHDEYPTPAFRLTNRRNCLILMESLLMHSKGIDENLNAANQNAIFKALLVINGANIKGQEEMFNWDGAGDADHFLDIVLPAHMGNLGITRMRDYQAQLIKAVYFFEFCMEDAQYSNYLAAFLKHYSFGRYEEYLRLVFHPYLAYMTNREPTPKFNIDPDFEAAISFFDHLAINGRPIVQDDFRTLREYPVYKSDKTTFTFLFTNFLADKMYMGMLFDFARIVPLGGFNEMNFGKLKNDLGNDFSEHVLFYRTMRRCFGRFGQVHISGEELKKRLLIAEPDFYIRDGRKVLLFEFKDVLLRADVKNSSDATSIREELTEKLDLSTKERTKAQPKATRQLLNSIQVLLSGDYRSLGIDDCDPETLMIYPVLVHTDAALETSGVNYFLKEKLNGLIADAGLPKSRIKDLAVVHIDMLLSIQDLFNHNKVTLTTCINDFIAFTKEGGVLNQMIPFDEFLKYYLARKKMSWLKASDEFNRLVQQLFTY